MAFSCVCQWPTANENPCKHSQNATLPRQRCPKCQSVTKEIRLLLQRQSIPRTHRMIDTGKIDAPIVAVEVEVNGTPFVVLAPKSVLFISKPIPACKLQRGQQHREGNDSSFPLSITSGLPHDSLKMGWAVGFLSSTHTQCCLGLAMGPLAFFTGKFHTKID